MKLIFCPTHTSGISKPEKEEDVHVSEEEVKEEEETEQTNNLCKIFSIY